MKKIALTTIILSTSVFSNHFICEVHLKEGYQAIDRFVAQDILSEQNACREALRECHKEKMLRERQGQIQNAQCEIFRGQNEGPNVGFPEYPAPGSTVEVIPTHIQRRLENLELLSKSQSWQIRRDVAIELRALPYIKSYKLLVYLKSDFDNDVKNAAESSLSIIKEHIDFLRLARVVIAEFAPLLESQSWRLRYEAVLAIGNIPSALGVIEIAKRSAETDGDVIRALNQVLPQKLSAPDIFQVARAERIRIQELIKSSYWRHRVAGVKIIQSGLLVDELPELVVLSADLDGDVSSGAKNAISVLIASPYFDQVVVNLVPELGQLLNSSSWRIRKMAVFVLGESRSIHARSFIIKALRDVDGDVRNEAEIALRKIM